MKQFSARILRNRPICTDFFEMAFAWDTDAAQPVPGQFFTVRVSQDTVPLLRRPFAVSSFSEKTLTAAIIYQRRGRGTEILCAKQKGDVIDVLGPLGRSFPLPEHGQKALLVAGGIGIGPVLSLARLLKRRGNYLKMIFGCRTSALVPRLSAFAALKPAICTDDGSAGFKGTTGDFLKSIEKSAGSDTILYACGPMAMLKRCHEFARRRGIVCHVSVEQIMACGEGPVFESKEIDWE